MKHKRFLRSVLATLLSSAMLLTPVLAQGITETISQLSTPTLSEDEVPAVLDFEEMKAKGHIKRLYEEETEMNQAVFENEDGTRTAYLFTEAIKYVDEDGKTKDKSQKLKSKFTVFENEENDLKVVYSRNLENGILMEYHGLEIEMFPQEIDQNVKSKVVKESKKNLSDSVEYKNAFGNHTTLRYLQNLNGIKEEILLEKETELRSFTFRILTHGAALAEEKGTVRIFKGEESFDLGEILMWDSAGKQAKGSYRIETVKEKEEYLLTMETGDFLDREDLQYPVTVDPSYTYTLNSSSHPSLIEDVCVYSDYLESPYLVNSLLVGNYDLLYEEYKDLGESGVEIIETKGEGIALFRFPSITTNVHILNWYRSGKLQSLELGICVPGYYDEDGTISEQGGFLEAYMLPADASWTEDTAIWNSTFQSNTTKLDRQYVPFNSKLCSYYMDITYAFQKWMAGESNNGIKLVNADLSVPAIPIYPFEMGISSQRPYLVATYSMTEFDDLVFRLKHVESGLYATVQNGYDIDTTDLILSEKAFLTESDSVYMDRSQLFRIEKNLDMDEEGTVYNDYYKIFAVVSRNGYYRKFDIVRSTSSGLGPLLPGQRLEIFGGDDPTAQRFDLVESNQIGKYRIHTDDNYDIVIDTESNNDGSILMTETFANENNQFWEIEVAYDYMQYEKYYRDMNLPFFFNLEFHYEEGSTQVIKDSNHPYKGRKITSGYGYRDFGGTFSHEGTDFANVYASDNLGIKAPFDSVVTEASDSATRGWNITIEATDPNHTTFYSGVPLRMAFMHMKYEPSKNEDEYVDAEEVLGYVGNTGSSTGPHLHVSVITNQGDSSYLQLWETMDVLTFYSCKTHMLTHVS